ncbi:hypothetical protein ES676_13395 [Bizionia saleffrena]|uniref:Lipoprotein n=1 Tax=Bizionia saleffrena TaxID=291189 RepID=A0A8H2LAP6_9FLAO|nr:hypothetical protein [Bizionia saleffrena]TYB70520.1 hypothetical protein ES676_13395 [Bizionia saleffrena]
MKITFIKSVVLLILFSLSGCQKEERIVYKYTEQPDLIICDVKNEDLYNEAIHSFENDIFAFYDAIDQSPLKGYTQFTALALNGRLKVEDIASEHSLKLAKALKNDNQLWQTTAGIRTLNYSSLLMDCLVNKIKNDDLKTTFNALLSTNSMRRNTILTPIRNNARQLLTDKSLKAFVAFEYYYAVLMDKKSAQLTIKVAPIKVNTAVDFNKTPRLERTPARNKIDNHEGHNHD